MHEIRLEDLKLELKTCLVADYYETSNTAKVVDNYLNSVAMKKGNKRRRKYSWYYGNHKHLTANLIERKESQ